MKISKRDKNIIWHPFTQEKTAPDVIGINRSEGSYLYDENNKSYLDLISSWWVNLHGHAHPEIAEAIYQQALKLEHVIFSGFTHEPAVNLCERLQTILPKELNKFFFSDNGSTAVEIALKMSYQYWCNLGKPQKNIFLSFSGGYHGDTFGAMSVGAKSGFHNQFSNFFFEVLMIPYPDSYENDPEIEYKEELAFKKLEVYLEQSAHNIAAIIVEPLIQGASGMRLCRPDFLKKALKLVNDQKILIIFDEVMTGFGRTGTYFALEQLNIIPDLLCLSKGITGGCLPLALTITQGKIYDAFLGETFQRAFAHGHSYTANPLACSAALVSLKLLQSSQCQMAIQQINLAHQQGMEFLKLNCKLLEKPRIIGTISAFDLKMDKSILPKIREKFLEKGLLLRPLGNTVYLLPPYSISHSELELTYLKISEIINFYVD